MKLAHPIQVWLRRLAIFGTVILFLCVYLAGDPAISIEASESTTVYTSNSGIYTFFFGGVSVISGILSLIYILQPGIYRFCGLALVFITVWVAYVAITTDASNHHVQVTSDGITREVGTRSDPIRHEIIFSNTTSMYIEVVESGGEKHYELVAIAGNDGVMTRVPIYDMMRKALPQIIEKARARGVVIGESENGADIPVALRDNVD